MLLCRVHPLTPVLRPLPALLQLLYEALPSDLAALKAAAPRLDLSPARLATQEELRRAASGTAVSTHVAGAKVADGETALAPAGVVGDGAEAVNGMNGGH